MHYSLYLFVGVIAWTAFVETTVAATTIVVGNGNLIQKVAFPAQLLPLHLVAVNTIVYAVGVVAYLVIAALTGFPLPGIELVGLPIVILIQSLFSLGMALFLAATYVFIRDINQVYPILVNFWFFTTPVFWWTGQFEHNPTMQALLPWLKLNPMYHILGAHRTVLGVRHGNLGDVFTQCGIALVPAALVFCFGFVLFRSLQHRFADEV